jgi:hypothetical protein
MENISISENTPQENTKTSHNIAGFQEAFLNRPGKRGFSITKLETNPYI